MDKNIFENQSGKKKITYYIILGVCIVVIGVISFISYKSIQDSISETPIQDITNNTDPVDTELEGVKDEKEQDTEVSETVTKPITQDTPKVETKAYIMPVKGEVTNKFSLDTPIYSNTLKDWRIHDGIDILAEVGTDVKCVNDGVIEEIRSDDLFGITVVVKHTDGKKSVYSNLEDSIELEEGQIINGGDTVGKIGNTAVYEISDGPHLHFEMSENGEKIDPLSVIK